MPRQLAIGKGGEKIGARWPIFLAGNHYVDVMWIRAPAGCGLRFGASETGTFIQTLVEDS